MLQYVQKKVSKVLYGYVLLCASAVTELIQLFSLDWLNGLKNDCDDNFTVALLDF